MAHKTGSLNQMILNASMGSIWTRFCSLYPSVLSAATAGWQTKSQSWLQYVRLKTKATATPMRARMMRVRSSSKWPRKDMRSMPSSSSSSPSPPDGGGGGGGVLPPPPRRRGSVAIACTGAGGGAAAGAGGPGLGSCGYPSSYLSWGSAGCTAGSRDSARSGAPACTLPGEDTSPAGGTLVPFCSSESVFGVIAVGENAHLADRFHRRPDHKRRLVEEVDHVDVVVDAVQQEVILAVGANSVGRETSAGGIARAGLGRQNARRKPRQEAEGSRPAQRKIGHILGV